MSKAFGLANFRVGYLIASAENVQFVNRIRNPKNISTIAQVAAVAAIEDKAYMLDYVEKVLEGKEYLVTELSKLSKIQVCNGFGNFLLLKFPSREEKLSLIQYLADHKIYVRDTMQSPIVQNCFRITCGTKLQMEQVVNAINAFYAR